MQKNYMTYDDYDKLCDYVAELPNRCSGWYPTLDEIEKRITESTIMDFLPFLTWILETGNPKTKKEKFTEKIINSKIQEYVVFGEKPHTV